MPRKPRPAITPAGTPEANRTDLMATRNQPIQAAAGGAYGTRKASLDAQHVQPLQAQQSPTVAPQAPPPGFDQQIASMRQAPPPNVVPLTAPTQRPLEPLTSGLANGPGAGPEALPMPPQRTRVADLYARLAENDPNSAWSDLADAARRLGQ